jgi:hypothetical protein
LPSPELVDSEGVFAAALPAESSDTVAPEHRDCSGISTHPEHGAKDEV